MESDRNIHTNEKKHQATSAVLSRVIEDNTADYISLGEIKAALHERGFGILMLMFALPMCVPLPLPPGFTIIPSIPLLTFSIQMLMGMDSPWMPKWVRRKKIKRSTLALMIEKAAPWLKMVERVLRPRASFTSSRTGERIFGLFCLLFSLSIALPLPFTNFIPGVGVAIMSLGLLSKDGFVIVLGMLVGMGGLVVTTLIVFLGQKAAFALLHTLHTM